MRFCWWFLVASIVTLVTAFALTPRAAWAQTSTTSGPSVTGILGTVQRCEPTDSSCGTSADNSGENPHPSGVLVNSLNFEDCDANLYYFFELGISAPSTSYELQAWAGTEDCSQLANRQTSATSVCWPVMQPFEFNSNQTNIHVFMTDIVSGAFTTTHPVSYTSPASTSVCNGQTATGATTITLYFFFTDPESNPVGTVQQYPVTVDLRAGDVQGNISVGVGDTVLLVNVPSTTDPDTQGWNVYCDPPPGGEGQSQTVPVDAPTNNGLCPAQVPDTGAASLDASVQDGATVNDASAVGGDDEDAGAPAGTKLPNDDAGGNPCGVALNEAGVPSQGQCGASAYLTFGGGSEDLSTTTNDAGETIFVEAGTGFVEEGDASVAFSGGTQLGYLQYGQPIGNKLLCAQGGATSTQLAVLKLKDNYSYNLAVAATDAVGNVGPLSNVVCGTPVPVNDFFANYYNDGGRAGGGFFCAAQGIGTPAGTGGLGVLMVSSMVTLIRRRRRRLS